MANKESQMGNGEIDPRNFALTRPSALSRIWLESEKVSFAGRGAIAGRFAGNYSKKIVSRSGDENEMMHTTSVSPVFFKLCRTPAGITITSPAFKSTAAPS
jgi:hypothetical protein